MADNQLKLYNTLTKAKEPFVPIDPQNVRMYVCGPTVYDFAHIGNARPAIVFDVLFRLLRHLYGPEHVTYVRNVTDVDDKINARAAERGIPIRELTEETLKQYHQDLAALGCLPPTVEPRATESIDDMKAMIEALVEKGHAYVADDHVLFDVGSMPDYGRLAHRSLEEMRAGARVEVAPYKRGPMDFVLWKPSREDEPAWPSPCGITTPGRPGWHIECSAMADRFLWREVMDRLSPEARARPHVFDIHGGGIDLVFPHHENELAQSRCAFGTEVMANYWLHNGFLQVEGRKMAKSEGNFVTIRDVLADWPGDVVRLTMLKTHYRQPIDWTLASLKEAQSILEGWYGMAASSPRGGPLSPAFVEALCDDLNTHQAFHEMHQLQRDFGGGNDQAQLSLTAAIEFLNLQGVERWRSHHQEVTAQLDWIDNVITERLKARAQKDFATADRIRDELAAEGIRLKDGKDPETGEPTTTWEIAR